MSTRWAWYVGPAPHGPRPGRFALGHYVNDRPYVASSYLSVALGRLFGTAMSGRSKERQDVADQAVPLEARLGDG